MSSAGEFGSAGKDAMYNAMRSFSAMTRGFQQIATETGEYTKRSYERSAQALEQLSQSRSVERAVEVQNEFARSAYEGWVSQAARFGEIYSGIARDIYQPFEASVRHATEFARSTTRDAA